MRTYVAVLCLAVAMLAAPYARAYGAGPGPCLVAGSLPTLAAEVASAAFAQAGFQPGFSKVYRKRLTHEIVWFDGREADLEKRARIINGRIYITLTDLSRHLGCSMVWGPSRHYIEVSRGNKAVVVCPGGCVATKVYGKPVAGPPAVQRRGTTWVPVDPFATLFGATVQWNAEARRLDVATTATP